MSQTPSFNQPPRFNGDASGCIVEAPKSRLGAKLKVAGVVSSIAGMMGAGVAGYGIGYASKASEYDISIGRAKTIREGQVLMTDLAVTQEMCFGLAKAVVDSKTEIHLLPPTEAQVATSAIDIIKSTIPFIKDLPGSATELTVGRWRLLVNEKKDDKFAYTLKLCGVEADESGDKLVSAQYDTNKNRAKIVMKEGALKTYLVSPRTISSDAYDFSGSGIPKWIIANAGAQLEQDEVRGILKNLGFEDPKSANVEQIIKNLLISINHVDSSRAIAQGCTSPEAADGSESGWMNSAVLGLLKKGLLENVKTRLADMYPDYSDEISKLSQDNVDFEIAPQDLKQADVFDVDDEKMLIDALSQIGTPPGYKFSVSRDDLKRDFSCKIAQMDMVSGLSKSDRGEG